MWISYSDSEVNKFHPICQKALENALAQIGKKDEYAVLYIICKKFILVHIFSSIKAFTIFLISSILFFFANSKINL